MAIEDFKVIVLDIEGTICPISFVKEVLVPFALESLPSTLASKWEDEDFKPYRDAFPSQHRASPDALECHARDLMSKDQKVPYLKSLQGYLWLGGYSSGSLRCPLFKDVAPAMQSWHRQSIPIIIYSSGSVPAQKLLFQYTDATEVDLRPLITDYFDTINAGPKQESSSYEKIMAAYSAWPKDKWVFLSDNVKEVAAAKNVGMQAVLLDRPGNAVLSPKERSANHVVSSFDEITGA